MKSARAHWMRGRVQVRGEFGFITPEGESVQDYRVDPQDLGQVMDGDTVYFTASRGQGRPVARIEEVAEHARKRVVGTIDIRGREPVLIAVICTDPIRLTEVGPGKLKPNQRAIAEIITPPTATQPARARLLRVLGEAGDPAVELEASRLAHNVPDPFPAEVIAAAHAMPIRVRSEDIAGRLDFRDAPVFTIDPTDARDFDDAISIVKGTPKEPDGWTVGIHIADVSYYVRAGEAVDREAYNRATSTYLPGSVIPMLPERLSNGVCSLVEGEERLTVSIVVEFDAQLAPRRFRHARSVIRSKRRFTYDEVDAVMEAGKGDYVQELGLLKRIAERLYRARLDRGAIDFDFPELKPVLDLEGKVMEIRRIERTWSHRLIEELMIMANEYAARTMQETGIYRVHEPPPPEKVIQFRRVAAALGRITTTGRGTTSRGSIQKILDSFRESPARPVIEMLALRSLTEARYAADNIGHFGLASDAYSHFTSPIRRYPDLIAHRLLLGEPTGVKLVDAARHSSQRERESMEAERDALKIKLLEYAAKRLGDRVHGVVDGVNREGLFVLLDCGPRGLVPMPELGREAFHFDRDTMTLTGRRTHIRYQVGQPMEVVIASVDLANRQLFLSPVRKPASTVRVDGEGAKPTGGMARFKERYKGKKFAGRKGGRKGKRR